MSARVTRRKSRAVADVYATGTRLADVRVIDSVRPLVSPCEQLPEAVVREPLDYSEIRPTAYAKTLRRVRSG